MIEGISLLELLRYPCQIKDKLYLNNSKEFENLNSLFILVFVIDVS